MLYTYFDETIVKENKDFPESAGFKKIKGIVSGMNAIFNIIIMGCAAANIAKLKFLTHVISHRYVTGCPDVMNHVKTELQQFHNNDVAAVACAVVSFIVSVCMFVIVWDSSTKK